MSAQIVQLSEWFYDYLNNGTNMNTRGRYVIQVVSEAMVTTSLYQLPHNSNEFDNLLVYTMGIPSNEFVETRLVFDSGGRVGDINPIGAIAPLAAFHLVVRQPRMLGFQWEYGELYEWLNDNSWRYSDAEMHGVETLMSFREDLADDSVEMADGPARARRIRPSMNADAIVVDDLGFIRQPPHPQNGRNDQVMAGWMNAILDIQDEVRTWTDATNA